MGQRDRIQISQVPKEAYKEFELGDLRDCSDSDFEFKVLVIFYNVDEDNIYTAERLEEDIMLLLAPNKRGSSWFNVYTVGELDMAIKYAEDLTVLQGFRHRVLHRRIQQEIIKTVEL